MENHQEMTRELRSPSESPATGFARNPSRKHGLSSLALFLAATVLVSFPGAADDWPTYRGPNHDGHSRETGLRTEWPEDGPPRLWKVTLGTGYSGISVANGRVYTQFGDGSDEYAAAFSAATGKEIWRFRTDSDRYDSQGRGPRSTPTVAEGTVFVLGALGKLHALAEETGEKRWSVDLVAEYGARVPQWGVSTSPTVYGDLLLLDAGGKPDHALLALDRKNGELRWHAQTDRAGYSTPLVAEILGENQALFFTASALVSVSADDGRLLWRHPWKTSYDVNAAMPVYLPPNGVFISSSYDTGAAALQVRKAKNGYSVEERWRSRVMKNHFNTSVLIDDYLYGFDDGTLKCIHAATGDEQWAKRGFAKGSLIHADQHLIVLGERGLLALVEATPKAYREKARSQALDGKTWTMPTLANGVLYLRTEKEMVAFSLQP